MHGLLKRPGYRLYAPESPEAEALLAEQDLTRADLDRALAQLERTEGARIRTIVGINGAFALIARPRPVVQMVVRCGEIVDDCILAVRRALDRTRG